MKTFVVEVLVLIAIGTIVQGCAAAIPFLPALASAVPGLLMSPMSSGKKDQTLGDTKPIEADPAIQKAIAAPAAIPGDSGMMIPQQDRVAFQPAAEGSIPLRVGAVDIVSDIKAHAVGDLVTVNVIESMSSESKAATSLAKTSSDQRGHAKSAQRDRMAEQALSAAQYQQPDKRFIGQFDHRQRRHVGQ